MPCAVTSRTTYPIISVYVKQKQELAVEDMRLELDDEGRRELEEEQGDEEGEAGSRVDGRFDEFPIYTPCFGLPSIALVFVLKCTRIPGRALVLGLKFASGGGRACLAQRAKSFKLNLCPVRFGGQLPMCDDVFAPLPPASLHTRLMSLVVSMLVGYA